MYICRAWIAAAALGLCLVQPVSSALAASSSTPLQSWRQGMALYNAYEFEKASAVIRKVIANPPMAWKAIDKSYALVILSVCQLNLARIKLAKRMYEDALALSRGVMLPPNLPENIKARYLAIRADWRKRHPLQKKNVVPKRKPKRRITRSKKVRVKRVVAKRAAAKRPTPRVAVASRKLPAPAPKRGFAHAGSLVVFCLAGAAVASAIGLGVVSMGHNNTMQQTPRENPDSAITINAAYQSALQTGIAATVMWVAAPVLGGVGVGLFVYESKKAQRQASLSSPRETRMAKRHAAPSADRAAVLSVPSL